MTDVRDNQVCRTEDGRFVGLWRGKIVHKFDGSLRYFETERAAWDFLARRDCVSSSVVGMSPAKGSKTVGVN
jgi:hypothetical protein